MPTFSPEERDILSPYVTSTDGDVYCVRAAPGIVGAAFARYSRAKGGFRETFLKEFVQQGVLDASKADALLRRVLIAFGDDSVGELEGVHLALENISILATKEWEDRRIGGSPIEQSTRYVFYDQKDAQGNYRYLRPAAVMASPVAAQYVQTMDFIFDTYCSLIEPMKAHYTAQKPMDEAEYDVNGDGVKEKQADVANDPALAKAFRITYEADMRTKACDTLRAILPLATKTNVGIFGNGRFFQHAISHCLTSDLPEANELARASREQLAKLIPLYVERAGVSAYQRETRDAMRTLTRRLLDGIEPAQQDDVTLAPRAYNEQDEDNQAIAEMLFPHSRLPLRQITAHVATLTAEQKADIIKTYIGNRKTRRDRPGRALESGYPYTFDLCTDFGTYKDLERHRMCSQQRQRYNPSTGFAMPADLTATGNDAVVRECVDRAVALHDALIAEGLTEEAQYAAMHGTKVRWTLGINDRALMHMVELRTMPQGHPSYRKVCQAMHRLVEARSSWRGAAMRFADHGSYESARGDAEARQRVKEAALEAKVAATQPQS